MDVEARPGRSGSHGRRLRPKSEPARRTPDNCAIANFCELTATADRVARPIGDFTFIMPGAQEHKRSMAPLRWATHPARRLEEWGALNLYAADGGGVYILAISVTCLHRLLRW